MDATSLKVTQARVEIQNPYPNFLKKFDTLFHKRQRHKDGRLKGILKDGRAVCFRGSHCGWLNILLLVAKDSI